MNTVANYSPDTTWTNVGSIDTATTAFTATGRASATVEATEDILILNSAAAPTGVPKAYLLRFRTDSTEDDTNVVEVLVCRKGTDHYNRIAALTITQGQQLDTGSIYFADTITPASEDALFDGEESNLANYIGHYYVRTLGFEKFVFQVTTLNSTTVYVDYCPLYE